MPIQLKSKTRIESAALPGIAFTVRRLAHIRRAEMDLTTVKEQAEMAALVREYHGIMETEPRKLLTPEARAARLTELAPDQVLRIGVIDRTVDLITQRYIKPASIRAGLVSIEGVTDEDGSPIATAEKLLASATPELNALINEIYEACEAASGLDAEETKNSQSPTTGDEPATAKTPDTATA
jgi:hypothetical protein